MNRIRTALIVAISGGVLFWLIIWLNAGQVIGNELGYFGGKRFPLFPTTPVTWATLATFSGVFGVLFALFAGVIAAALSNWKHLMAVAVPVWCVAAYWAGCQIGFEIQVDFGATWLPFEAYRAFFFRPVLTPALTFAGLIAWLWIIHRTKTNADRRIISP